MPIIGSIGAGSAGGFGQRKGKGAFPATLDYLVIAGGGGGGAGASPDMSAGGGGGAGGYRYASGCISEGGSFPIVVGAGGVQGFHPVCTSTSGSPSSFDACGTLSLTSTGGGGGGSLYACGFFPHINTCYASPGGSGGGGSAGGGAPGSPPAIGFGGCVTGGTGNAGSYSPPEGNNGGTGQPGAAGGGAGGGGASAVGGNAGPGPTGNEGGDGGNGSSAWPGDCTVRAGGGGGGGGGPRTPAPSSGGIHGNGGTGGGGRGASGGPAAPPGTGPAVAGTANTGGGGGGGGGDFGPATGGSGVVLVKIPAAAGVCVSPCTNTVSPTPCGAQMATFTVTGTLTIS